MTLFCSINISSQCSQRQSQEKHNEQQKLPVEPQICKITQILKKPPKYSVFGRLTFIPDNPFDTCLGSPTRRLASRYETTKKQPSPTISKKITNSQNYPDSEFTLTSKIFQNQPHHLGTF